MDVTTDVFISKMLDPIIRRREPAHVKFYSIREYRFFFTGAHLRHIDTDAMMMTLLKVHIGEKSAVV